MDFIYYVNKKKLIPEQFNIENNFENISDITILSLKMYYLNILSLSKQNYEKFIYILKKSIAIKINHLLN